MTRTSLAQLLLTCLVAVPFVPGCEGAVAEEEGQEAAPALVGSACAGDDCAATEGVAASDVPTALAAAPADVAKSPAAAAFELDALGTTELAFREIASEVEPLPSLEKLPDVQDLARGRVTWKTEKQDRFGNSFKLDMNGNLFRFFGGTRQCQVTNNVLDFKMNMHPADEAVAYLVRNEGTNNGVLYALMDSPVFGVSQCPKSVRVRALAGLTGNVNDSYKIVSNTKDWELGTTVSMMAINGVGDLVGWRGRAAVWVNHPSVKFDDVSMNTCYGSKDASFSSYVGFLLEKTPNRLKRVLKVKGRNSVAESKWDTRTFTSVQEFKNYYKVCTKGSDTYPTAPTPPGYLTKTISCSSASNSFRVCDPQIGMGYVEKAELVRQTSTVACRSTGTSPTFGWDSKSLWTEGGCGGSFKVTYLPAYY
jgi:hypothetical protein